MEELYISVNGETYINVPALYSLGADVYIVFGERSGGKSYSVMRGMFDEFCATGAEFAYIRTREDYFKGGKALKAMADHKTWLEQEKWKGEAELNYRLGTYTKVSVGRNGKPVSETIGHTISLGSWIKYKSTSYPNVKTIFFDEFIEDAETTTIKQLSENEYINGWIMNLSTIIRRRTDVKVVCCANSLNPTAPLFKYYGIDARHIKQGKTYLFTDKKTGLKICVHYTVPIDHAAPDKHIAVYESKDTEMTIGGAWQEDRYLTSYDTHNWTWYAHHSSRANRIYLADYKITFVFSNKVDTPLLVISGKYNAGNTLVTTQIYLPSMHRLAQLLIYYKNISSIIVSDARAGENFNDFIRRITIDKK